MKETKLVSVESTKLNAIGSELNLLFMNARSARTFTGVSASLRRGYVREMIDSDCEGGETEFIPLNRESCDVPCNTDDSADVDCDDEPQEACSLEEAIDYCSSESTFGNVASLLTTVKKYEYISLVQNAYAAVGNKPSKFKAGKDPVITDAQLEGSAAAFYQFLEKYLESNKVRIDEIAAAFNLDTLSEVTEALADAAQHDAEVRVQESINSNEIVMEKVFKRSNFMARYIEMMIDTADYPIGVMWIDDKAMKKERVIRNGVMKTIHSIQCDANRIDPCYFWATDDYGVNDIGRAVFKMERFTKGDIVRWMDEDIAGSSQVIESIEEFLESYEDGYRMREACLFSNDVGVTDGLYDVLVSRGRYNVESVKNSGVKIPEVYSGESHVPCEVYYSGGKVLRLRVMECVDDRLGVYTTTFRRRGKSIFGWSLHDFIYPFAKMYSATLEAIDISVGKSIGSIIQVDTGVINDPDKYLEKNETTGEVSLNLSEDNIIEFDSTAAFGAHNFKGMPVTVNQLPSDINQLIPVIDFIGDQMEMISGIPNILTKSGNISSALRTTSNFNASFAASAKAVQALLREGETKVLMPSIRYIFDAKAMSGDMKDFLIEAHPEILLSDTLARETNDNNESLQGLLSAAQFRGLIPDEKLGGLINRVGRELWNLEEDLVPGVGALKTGTPSAGVQSV